MGSLALVLVLSFISGVFVYVNYDTRVLQTSVEAKAGVYATNLAQQLYNPVAASDRAMSEAVIKPLESDRNVYGIAVYAIGGQLLAGHGRVPPTLKSREDARLDEDRVFLVVREIPIEQGASGHLLLALSTDHIATARMRAAQ